MVDLLDNITTQVQVVQESSAFRFGLQEHHITHKFPLHPKL